MFGVCISCSDVFVWTSSFLSLSLALAAFGDFLPKYLDSLACLPSLRGLGCLPWPPVPLFRLAEDCCLFRSSSFWILFLTGVLGVPVSSGRSYLWYLEAIKTW